MMLARETCAALLDVDRIRAAQEERLAQALAAWEQAKEDLKEAAALVETREREYQETTAEVRMHLAALEIVVGLAEGGEPKNNTPLITAPAARIAGKPVPTQTLFSAPVKSRSLFTRSRPLLPPARRTPLSALSILQ
jgi:hypothetical protein